MVSGASVVTPATRYRLQLLGEGANAAAARRDKSVLEEASALREEGAVFLSPPGHLHLEAGLRPTGQVWSCDTAILHLNYQLCVNVHLLNERFVSENMTSQSQNW